METAFDLEAVQSYMTRHKLSVARMAELAGLKSPMKLRRALEGAAPAPETVDALMSPIIAGVVPPPPPPQGKGERETGWRRAAVKERWGTATPEQLAIDLECTPQRVRQLAKFLGLTGKPSTGEARGNGRSTDTDPAQI